MGATTLWLSRRHLRHVLSEVVLAPCPDGMAAARNRGGGFVDLGVLARRPTGKICFHSLWPGSSRVPYRDTYAHRPPWPRPQAQPDRVRLRAQAGSGRKSRHGRRGRQRSAPPDQYRDPCGCLKGRGYRDGGWARPDPMSSGHVACGLTGVSTLPVLCVRCAHMMTVAEG